MNFVLVTSYAVTTQNVVSLINTNSHLLSWFLWSEIQKYLGWPGSSNTASDEISQISWDSWGCHPGMKGLLGQSLWWLTSWPSVVMKVCAPLHVLFLTEILSILIVAWLAPPRATDSRKHAETAVVFYDLALEVTQCHICCTSRCCMVHSLISHGRSLTRWKTAGPWDHWEPSQRLKVTKPARVQSQETRPRMMRLWKASGTWVNWQLRTSKCQKIIQSMGRATRSHEYIWKYGIYSS